jgi:hypothetical protein
VTHHARRLENRIMPNPLHMSRRGLLRGAAGIGAAGLVSGVAVQAFTSNASGAADSANAAGTASGEPMVAHVRDVRTGEVDLFVGTRKVRFRDPRLAARLAEAAR